MDGRTDDNHANSSTVTTSAKKHYAYQTSSSDQRKNDCRFI